LTPSISRSGKSSSTAYGKMQKGKKPAAAWVPAVTNLRQGRHTATKISLQRALATRNRKIRQPKQRVWPRTASTNTWKEGNCEKIESQPGSSLFVCQKRKPTELRSDVPTKAKLALT